MKSFFAADRVRLQTSKPSRLPSLFELPSMVSQDCSPPPNPNPVWVQSPGEGLVDYRSEAELARNASRAYARYRANCFRPSWRFVSPVYYLRVARKTGSALLDKVLKREPLPKRVHAADMAVRFLGRWDTVGAYGMPVEALRPVINCLIWPMLWNNLELSPKVARACHALALDDERTTFHPISPGGGLSQTGQGVDSCIAGSDISRRNVFGCK